jgi:hypothetical protein
MNALKGQAFDKKRGICKLRDEQGLMAELI